jgi:hypothetical protein
MAATGRMVAPCKGSSWRPAPQVHQPPTSRRLVVETPILLLPPCSVPAQQPGNSLHHRRRRAPSWITSTPISAAAAVDPQTGEGHSQESAQSGSQSLLTPSDVGSAPCWTDELDEVQRQVREHRHMPASTQWFCSSGSNSSGAGLVSTRAPHASFSPLLLHRS